MKKIFLLSFLLLLVFNLFAQTVNGELLQIEDKQILKVWGTHQERGFAYGSLLAEEIKDVMENYIISNIFSNSAYFYDQAMLFFQENYAVDADFEQEAHGMISGMENAGLSLYSSTLNRDLDEMDVLMANSIVDLSVALPFLQNVLHCSSISSWGNSTIDDPMLQGETLITRLLDWTPDQTLLDNQLLIVHFPSEPDEQKWISFSFAGMIGALSGINENQIAAFMNVGNNHNANPNLDTLNPIFFSIRLGLENSDYNNNGVNNPNDVFTAISDHDHLSGSITHVISSAQCDSSTIVIECNNQNGAVVRTADDNTLVTGDNLVATNHFRSLYSPVYCNRYENIVDSLNVSTQISIDRSWQLICGAAGTYGNIQVIEFVPCSEDIFWATSPSSSSPAYTITPTQFQLDDLLQLTSVENQQIPTEQHVLLYPNPIDFSRQELNIRFDLKTKQVEDLAIYNLRGQLIREYKVPNTNSLMWDGKDSNNTQCGNGVYFLKATFKDNSEEIVRFNVLK